MTVTVTGVVERDDVTLSGPKPSEPLSITFGTVLTATAVPVMAYKGFGPRVHARAEDACIDLATQELAQRWLAVCPQTVPPSPTFNQLLDWIAYDPDLFEAAVALVRTRMIYLR